ncbi:FliA/WhiG family RNA polymerase sigma factor [Meridianimarinicoccus roseus]|jgi:RNA polymerase sigma factor for flagellar operon FliA|uniref:FliA/WhiG family RNA polymerase sigma factor n=1 Tax=Meridianimarinicoccus roseus TaxID=2072018 RepID=A0A2V2LJR3_9RHOB|nr:FliA/WhiG family RNA polymerase sigma factor [Meridianimarinicoccus roseus]PWR02579.1 FliA/WhiG family RNA polymerase sigma factor [Meridianimarinicoccus roseus]
MIAPKGYREQSPSPDRLVEDNLNIVRRLAWHFHGRVGRFIEIEDLLQAGYLGLIDASRRYTVQDGVNFSAYAGIRVRGAIIDYLRRNSNLCRSTIAMQKKIKKAEQVLEGRLLRTPEPHEIAEHLNMEVSELKDWQSQFQANQVRSLDEVYSDHSLLFQDQTQSPEEATHSNEMRQLLRNAMRLLPEREALVLQLYYVEELNVYEVAAIMDVTTGRVSQIKKAAIERLRGHLMEKV